MERPDLKHALDGLLGPAEPEVGCDECFDLLDRYVELEVNNGLLRDDAGIRIWSIGDPGDAEGSDEAAPEEGAEKAQ